MTRKPFTIITNILAAAVLFSSAEALEAKTALPANMEALAPYVYPQNRAVTPSRPAFTPDGLSCLKLADDGRSIVSYDLATGKPGETVLDMATTRENKIGDTIDSFILSPDGSKILIATGTEAIYRRSTAAKYWVYEIRSRLLRPLSETWPMQRAPLFSPDGRMIAFVGPDNNIYIKKTDYDTEVAVTRDGKNDHIINGVPDWVYEEEFTTSQSMAWAPDNMTLCYLKYNETRVPAYSFTVYGGACDPIEQFALYPGRFTYKYPVAGEPNSVVTLHSYDVDNRKIKDVPLPDGPREYIPRIAYGGQDPDRLMVVTLNRDQNHMEIFSVNPRSGMGRSVLSEKSEAWLPTQTYEDLTFEADGFVVLSARSGWLHAYAYNYAGAPTQTITSGDYDVTAYYGRDAKGNRYVQSTRTGSINRAVYRLTPKGEVKLISPAEGTSSAWFNPAMSHYCLTHSTSATAPEATLYAASNDKKVRTLLDGSALTAKYASAPRREFFTLTTDEGIGLNAYIIKPADFSPSRKYPVIMYQYSGPGSQEVADRWRTDWTQYAALKGYVVVCVDPRGTMGHGRAFETIVYRDLGRYETIDLRAAARWVASQSWADPQRIGITGWSYGGYETLMAITAPYGGSNPFAAAVAIAPVTDWRYYDTVYAERYMLTPGQNGDGYVSSAPISYADKVSVPLLIMHGTADDNVHLANTMEYISVMQQGGRFCDMLLYPNMNHSINGCDMRLNVYSKMLDYFDRNL